MMCLFAGTSVVFDNPSDNNFVLRGSGTSPSQSDYLKVLRSVSYYNFNGITTASTRQAVFVTTSNGVLSASVSAIRLQPIRNLNCTNGTRNNVDVVFLLDSSSNSSSPLFWKQMLFFLPEILEKLPVSSNNYRYALSHQFECGIIGIH